MIDNIEDIKLDWVKSRDLRNYNHLAATELPTMVPRKQRLHRGPYFRLDQGPDGACVGFGWTGEALAMPVIYRPSPYSLEGCNKFAYARYQRAQQVDEFRDTPPEEGSSVNGGGIAMREVGAIDGWKWHENVDSIIDAVIVDGPQVLGTTWLRDMFYPREHNILSVTGSVSGGHCYLIRGYIPKYYGVEVFVIRNSWGARWGDNGDAFLPVAGLRGLWADDAAECAMPVGRKYAPKSFALAA